MTTIVTRAGKGSPLTHTEVDTNFTNLNTAKLEAGAIALGSAGTPSISFVSDTNTGIFSPGADQVAISTNGTNRLHITSGGLVGIGTTSPAQLLQINSTSVDARLHITNSVTGSTNSDGFQIQVNHNDVFFHLQETGDIYFQSGASTRAIIDSSGRLLVGTSTNLGAIAGQAAQKLQIAGSTDGGISMHTFGADAFACNLEFKKSRSATIGTHTIVQNGDTLGKFYYCGSDGTDFEIAASIEAFVDGTPGANDMPGRLVFSTTSDSASSPTERMRINSTGVTTMTGSLSVVGVLSDAIVASHASATFSSAILSLGTSRAAGTACFFIYAAANGVNTFNVFNNGNVTNTNNSYAGISDVKLKENIVDANSQWDNIKDLQVRNYNFKEETGHQTHTQIGLVAQEVELVSPGLVTESPDRDEDGNDLGTVTKSVNYSVLYMKAVKALQEAMERIEQLETSNTDLLARVIALEAN